MPSKPQPRWRDTSLMIQLVTEPTVETPILRPFRSSTVLTESSLRTTRANKSGGPAIAAMPFTGEPLTMKARPGPEPSEMSTPSAAIACCSRASPPKLLISTSRPCRVKMPDRTPTSSGTKEKASRPALPTRRVSAEAACAERAMAATSSNLGIVFIILPSATRHARACRGHPRLRTRREKDVDGRDKPGHDDVDRSRAVSRSTPRSYRIPLSYGPGLVQRQIVPQRHPIVVARRRNRNESLPHVVAHGLRVALQRVAKAAAAAGAHDHLRIHRHRHMAAGHGPEIVLARQPQQVIAELAGLAAPQAPGRAILPPCVLEIPFALDQVAHPHVDAEPAAEFSGAAGTRPQAPPLDQHRAFELDALDRAVAHVALAHRHGRGLAILGRSAAPAAAFQALHHEALIGFRMHAEKHDRAAEQPVVAGRHAVGHGLGECRHDRVDDRRHDRAPARHRSRKARHHDAAFRDDD